MPITAPILAMKNHLNNFRYNKNKTPYFRVKILETLSNNHFSFKQFTVWQDKCAMKVGTDAVLLGAWANVTDAESILDIGSGTGLISLMLAQRSVANIDAVEIDNEAYAQSLDNIRKSIWFDRINVHLSSFQEFAKNTTKSFSTIVTNPPFFIRSLKTDNQQRMLARHNDELPFSDILWGVSKLLTQNGTFFIILPYAESQLFIADATLHHLYCVQKLNIKPSVTKNTNRVLMKFSRTREKCDEKELTIRDAENNYTSDYIDLTSAYYLNF